MSMTNNSTLTKKKIGQRLLDKLTNYPANTRHRVILKIDTQELHSFVKNKPRPDGEEITKRILDLVNGVIPLVDKILMEYGGRRTNPNLSTVSSIAMEGTKDAIFSLAELNEIEAIIDDQPVYTIPTVDVSATRPI